MNLTEGTKGWFTPFNGGDRQRGEVIKVWGPTCVNLRLADGTTASSVLLKQDGCAGHFFEPDQVDAIEQEIRDKGLTAPRVTPPDIEAAIASEWYFSANDGATADGIHSQFNGDEGDATPHALDLLTFCVLVLRNGFTVTGESACASPENFNAELGRKIARQAAINKLWPLMGYELRSKLAGPSDKMVERFLQWPVPAHIHPDGTPGQPGRTGTNLLDAQTARDMLQHVLAG